MSDEALLAALRADETDTALQAVYQKYREPCLRFLLGRIIQPDQPNRMELARDLYTEALIILVQNVRSGRLTALSARLDTYLNAVAKNLYRKQLRQKRETYLEPGRLPEPLVAPEVGPEEAEIVRRELHRKMRQLGDRCRLLLVHFYFLGLDWKSIADLLGYKNAASAKTNKSKCMVRLRALYGIIAPTHET